MHIKFDLFLFLILGLSIIGGIWHSQFINDGYHWGYIFSNSLDLVYGKKPYSEIFLEYGFLQHIINFVIIKIFGQKIFIIQIFTVLTYAFSLYFLNRIILLITNDKKISFYSILIVFLLYPWPTAPWPNFLAFFFINTFIYFYLKDNILNSYLAGISIFLAYISYTTLFNFILFFYVLSVFSLFLNNFYKIKSNLKFNKNILIIYSILLIFFFLYLISDNLFYEWVNYQKIPFLVKSTFEYSFFDLFFDYAYFLFLNPIFKFVHEPQWLIYSTLFLFNLISIFFLFFKLYKKKIDKFETKLLSIFLLIFLMNFFGQSKNLIYFATSVSLSIVSLSYFFNEIKSIENKYIIKSLLTLFIIYSLFNFDMKYSQNADTRKKSLEYLKNKNVEINNEINYFEYFKWDKDYWSFLNLIENKINTIQTNCKDINNVNITENSFLYILLGKKTFQRLPFYLDSSDFEFNKIFDPNFFVNIQRHINNENILILSHKKNENIFEFNNKFEVFKINLKSNKIINEEFRIIYPKKCN